MGISKAVHVVSGVLGIDQGMDTTTADYAEEDADGNPTDRHYIVDLPHLLSKSLGKQIGQMATFRLKGLGMSLRNVDNTNDNNYGLAVGGKVAFYQPTKHRIDALQYTRDYKRASTGALVSSSSDPFAPWQSEKHYRGLRLNFRADGEIEGQTADGTSRMPTTNLNLEDVFEAYNHVIAGNVGEAGYPTSGDGMALWTSRVGYNETTHLFWNSYYRNSAYQDGTGFENAFIFQPEFGAWEYNLPADNHLDVLAGLLDVTITHTNTDNPRAGDVNDEYFLQFYCLVEGWEEF